MFQVWYGTPNQMEPKGQPGTLAAACKLAIRELRSREETARKFDLNAVEHIRSTVQQIDSLVEPAFNVSGRVGWEFPLTWVRYRIEIRKVPS